MTKKISVPLLPLKVTHKMPDSHLTELNVLPSPRLRLAIATHFVYSGRVGGAEHMLYNLIRGFWRNDVYLDLLCGQRENLDAAFLLEVNEQKNVRVFENGRNTSRFISEQLSCFDSNLSADVILFPNYFVPPIIPSRLGAVVCVLHDMQYRHIRANFSWRKRLWLRLAHHLAVRCCDRLVVISEFVRQDALRWLGNDFSDRIEVIPNPISWDRFGGLPSGVPPFGEKQQPCILSLCAQYEHKNLPTLIRAFAILVSRRPDVRLVLCGQDYGTLRGVSGTSGDLMALSRSLGIADHVRITGYVDDNALAQLFREATVFAFPSVFEGFGMPPVEALGLGLPTLTTRSTALPEVTLGLAQYVEDPYDLNEWASRLEAMVDDPDAFRPGAADIVRLQTRYSPKGIAAAYIDLCQRVLTSRRV
jgi:glycosyltransferase involved in cell wall biosynthesis